MTINPAEIKLTEAQRRYLAQRAEETGKPWLKLLEELVPAAISQTADGAETNDTTYEPQSLYDALDRDGLIGCIEGGPSDLSTHPKYLEGFGRDHSSRAD